MEYNELEFKDEKVYRAIPGYEEIDIERIVHLITSDGRTTCKIECSWLDGLPMSNSSEGSKPLRKNYTLYSW